jgi:plastocyanin
MLACVKSFTNGPTTLVKEGILIRRLIPLAIVVTAISVAMVACGGDEASPTATSTSPSPPPARPTTPAGEPTEVATGTNGASTGEGREITIVNQDPGGGGDYVFEPADVEATVGETVTFKLIAKTELHSFTIDALEIDQDIDGSQERDKVEFVTHTFDKAGTYDIVCIYHEGSGMVGTLTVK